MHPCRSNRHHHKPRSLKHLCDGDRMRYTQVATGRQQKHTRLRGPDFPDGVEFVIPHCRTNDNLYLTVQIQLDKHLQRKPTDSKTGKLGQQLGLTTGGTSAMVATKSQTKPFQEKNKHPARDATSPTCFQRSCPKANMVPCWRSRSRPTSIVRSKTTSVTSKAMTVLLPLSVFSTSQTLCAGSHPARICQSRQSACRSRKSKTTEGEHSPLRHIYEKSR